MEWPSEADEARRLQKELSERVRIEPFKKTLRYIAGADASYLGEKIIGAMTLFSYSDMRLLEEVWAVEKIGFPYIPGLLSFREGPVLLKASKKLTLKPDLILFDGHGICHPERLGIASHMGVILDIPTIGVAKSLLIGEYKEPGSKRGDRSYIYIDGEIRGVALRTRSHTKPIFVSPGHMVGLEDSIDIVLNCCKKYRSPEPLRRADILSRIIRKRIHE
ncbi:MAG: deoxyribonuclease V [Thermodesulfovibrionales bacterium]|nr:deoxyribonuclease V [Thermodesulfovibrionales bacterium]